MSSIQIANHLLSASSAVTDITTADRIFPIFAPQNSDAPYLVVNQVSGNDQHLLGGDGQYFRDRVSIECIGRTAVEVTDLGNAVRAALKWIIKQSFLSFKDVDVTFADVDMTQPNDTRTACQRVIHFFVQWRYG